MFEGKILPHGSEPGSASAEFGADGLRPLGWEELVARLGAARDLRRIMKSRHEPDGGSFNRASARHLASFGEGKPGINPFALTSRKLAGGMEIGVTFTPTAGDRGTE